MWLHFPYCVWFFLFQEEEEATYKDSNIFMKVKQTFFYADADPPSLILPVSYLFSFSSWFPPSLSSFFPPSLPLPILTLSLLTPSLSSCVSTLYLYLCSSLPPSLPPYPPSFPTPPSLPTPLPPSGPPSQGTQSANPHNDYSQHFVDTCQRPQNFIRDVGIGERFREYPKLNELMRLKVHCAYMYMTTAPQASFPGSPVCVFSSNDFFNSLYCFVLEFRRSTSTVIGAFPGKIPLHCMYMNLG